MSPLAERLFARRIVSSSGCWLSTLYKDKDGYSRIYVQGHNVRVHRAAYELWVGPIPEGLTIEHRCRVRSCFNPAHLAPMTQADNTLLGETLPAVNAGKTHCPQGHEYTKENTYVYVRSGRTSRSERQCLACRTERNKQRRFS